MASLQTDYERRLREQKADTSAKIRELQEELTSLDTQLDKAQRELDETHAINASLNKELTTALSSNGSHPAHAEELAAAQKKTEWLKRENAQLEKRCEIACVIDLLSVLIPGLTDHCETRSEQKISIL